MRFIKDWWPLWILGPVALIYFAWFYGPYLIAKAEIQLEEARKQEREEEARRRIIAAREEAPCSDAEAAYAAAQDQLKRINRSNGYSVSFPEKPVSSEYIGNCLHEITSFMEVEHGENPLQVYYVVSMVYIGRGDWYIRDLKFDEAKNERIITEKAERKLHEATENLWSRSAFTSDCPNPDVAYSQSQDLIREKFHGSEIFPARPASSEYLGEGRHRFQFSTEAGSTLTVQDGDRTISLNKTPGHSYTVTVRCRSNKFWIAEEIKQE